MKMGENELETVKNLMAMSLKAVVSEALHADMEGIDERTRLVDDLHMDNDGNARLKALIADIFDGLEVEPERMSTFGDLLERMVLSEFEDLAA
jgi:hypothetical protein